MAAYTAWSYEHDVHAAAPNVIVWAPLPFCCARMMTRPRRNIAKSSEHARERLYECWCQWCCRVARHRQASRRSVVIIPASNVIRSEILSRNQFVRIRPGELPFGAFVSAPSVVVDFTGVRRLRGVARVIIAMGRLALEFPFSSPGTCARRGRQDRRTRSATSCRECAYQRPRWSRRRARQ